MGKDNAIWFQERFARAAEKHGMRILNCPSNKISFVCDLTALLDTPGKVADDLSFMGSALFTRRVSGPRVVKCDPPGTGAKAADMSDEAEAKPAKGKFEKAIDGITFQSYGAHAETYKCCYLTAACAIGATRDELDLFLERFDKAVLDYKDGGK